ncbi:MAG: hypothetical protein U0031_03600 [Thermomicrobiales bacterium]
MDDQRFDAQTRRFGFMTPRRGFMTSFIAGATLRAVTLVLPVEPTIAACKGFHGRCASTSLCCSGAGLRCAKNGKNGKKRCRCRPGWQRCPDSGSGCLPVLTDPENCGGCGKQCVGSTPCCVGGECRSLCDGSCCADCFVQIDGTGRPAPGSDFCCPAEKICGPNPNKLSDDRCCYPNEACVAGECCCDGCLGSVICGGECCAEAACCNGACCPTGKICAATPNGDACVSANRACDHDQDCYEDESCHGGVCCSGARMCSNNIGSEFCCAVGTICELPGTLSAVCCPIGTTCNSFKGHRVRR